MKREAERRGQVMSGQGIREKERTMSSER